jgi:hypothetical protein
MLPEPKSAQTVLQTKYGKFHWHVFSWSDNEQDNVMVLVPETVIASVPPRARPERLLLRRDLWKSGLRLPLAIGYQS